MADTKTMTASVAVFTVLITMLLACTSSPDPEWPYGRLHPDLAHKVMHAKEVAAPGQAPTESEPVNVTIRVEPGQDGAEVTQWLDNYRLHFTIGLVFGHPGPGLRNWFGFGSDKENTFRASVPILLLTELSWVTGVDYIEEEQSSPAHHGR